MTRCSTCQRELPESEFYSNKARAGGLHNVCIECTAEYHRRYVSLDAPVHRGYTHMLGECLAAKPPRSDGTYERVYQALAYWIAERSLTPAQAEAVYLHAVEMFSFQEIAAFVGLTHSTVQYHYNAAIGRLRSKYEQEGAEMYGS